MPSSVLPPDPPAKVQFCTGCLCGLHCIKRLPRVSFEPLDSFLSPWQPPFMATARYGCVCGKLVSTELHPGPVTRPLTEEERSAIAADLASRFGWIKGRQRPYVCSLTCYDAFDPDRERTPQAVNGCAEHGTSRHGRAISVEERLADLDLRLKRLEERVDRGAAPKTGVE